MIVLSYLEVRKARKKHKYDTLKSTWGKLETAIFFCKGKDHYSPVKYAVIENDSITCRSCLGVPTYGTKIVDKNYEAPVKYKEVLISMKINRRPY